MSAAASRTPESRLRIGIDARDLAVRERTGVERVVAQFIANLPKGCCEYILFIDRPLLPEVAADLPSGVVVVPIRHPWLQRVLDFWIAGQMPAVLRRHRIDAFFSPNTKFPPGPVPAITTVHGVEWHFHPSGYRRLERIKQWVWFQLATRHSAGIVTFAQNTRADILRMRPGCDRPIRVVPEGVDPMFRRIAPAERSHQILTRLGIDRPFVLSVCSLVPRKNLDGLIRAFALLQQPGDRGYQLVLVGRSGWKAEELHALVSAQGINASVLFTGYLSDADLVQLYNHARVFAYPSMYEGFGLPPLEAMHCGLPVVTSDRSATAEIGRGAAVLVNPESVDDIAAGLKAALTDEPLRQRLISAGVDRAGQYSWAAMADGIVAFIAEIVAARAARGGSAGPPQTEETQA